MLSARNTGMTESQGHSWSLNSLAMASYKANNLIQYLQKRDIDRIL